MDKWTEIDQFRHAIKYIQNKLSHITQLTFTGTVKIHGANAGVSLHEGRIDFQSRKRVLSKDDDLYGFVAQMESDPTAIMELTEKLQAIQPSPSDRITVYGEWCGAGIQSNVAVSQLPNKHFVVFGAKCNGVDIGVDSSCRFNTDWIHCIYQFPTYKLVLDMTNLESALETLEQYTKQVEDLCPVGSALGVDGIGEGIVWTCDQYPHNTNLWFKTKGEKHSNGSSSKIRKVATIDPEKLKCINDVVDYVLPMGRLQQGLEHVDQLDMKCTGQYLKWICLDVRKEELDTIEHNGLDWKDVVKPITSKARSYFTQKVNSNLMD